MGAEVNAGPAGVLTVNHPTPPTHNASQVTFSRKHRGATTDMQSHCALSFIPLFL